MKANRTASRQTATRGPVRDILRTEGRRLALYRDELGYFEANATPSSLGRIRRITVREAARLAAQQLSCDVSHEAEGIPRLLHDLAIAAPEPVPAVPAGGVLVQGDPGLTLYRAHVGGYRFVTGAGEDRPTSTGIAIAHVSDAMRLGRKPSTAELAGMRVVAAEVSLAFEDARN